MTRFAALPVGIVVLLAGCGRSQAPPQTPTTPHVAVPTAVGALTARDVRMLVAVRIKALQRLEESVARVEQSPKATLAGVTELISAERDAAAALGMDWRHYTWVRERAGQVWTEQRQAEDRRLLMGELTRTRDDLLSQMAQSTDAASRQFLQAQLGSVEVQLGRLRQDQRRPPQVAEEERLLDAARVDLATLQSREEHLQERLRLLLRKASAGGGAGSRRETPGSP
ncbi:MAG TPA: hypothetical protein PLS53_04930 [Thermoanaerobaculaceae bacterium]|nr:hypothetical protein [Thermoanaerobaculaceae bacterium]HPS77480.1 hypothetical protein [Thermoanaerobaculaceae bacterium]